MSSVQCRVSNVEYRMSSIECRVLNVKYRKIKIQKSRIKKVSDATKISDVVFAYLLEISLYCKIICNGDHIILFSWPGGEQAGPDRTL